MLYIKSLFKKIMHHLGHIKLIFSFYLLSFNIKISEVLIEVKGLEMGE